MSSACLAAAGQDLDLQRLYRLTTELGGAVEVTDQARWPVSMCVCAASSGQAPSRACQLTLLALVKLGQLQVAFLAATLSAASVNWSSSKRLTKAAGSCAGL